MHTRTNVSTFPDCILKNNWLLHDRLYCCLQLETFLSNMSFPHEYDSTQPSMFQRTDHNFKKNTTYQTWDKNGSGLVKKLHFQIRHDLFTQHSREIFKLRKPPLHLEVWNTVVEKGGLFLLRTEEIVVELCDMTVCLAASIFQHYDLDGRAAPMSLLFFYFFIKQVRQRQTSEVYLSLHSSSKIWKMWTFYYFYVWM